MTVLLLSHQFHARYAARVAAAGMTYAEPNKIYGVARDRADHFDWLRTGLPGPAGARGRAVRRRGQHRLHREQVVVDNRPGAATNIGAEIDKYARVIRPAGVQQQ